MVSFISKFLFTATVTAPTFLSLGLIGVIKDSTNYFQLCIIAKFICTDCKIQMCIFS